MVGGGGGGSLRQGAHALLAFKRIDENAPMDLVLVSMYR